MPTEPKRTCPPPTPFRELNVGDKVAWQIPRHNSTERTGVVTWKGPSGGTIEVRDESSREHTLTSRDYVRSVSRAPVQPPANEETTKETTMDSVEAFIRAVNAYVEGGMRVKEAVIRANYDGHNHSRTVYYRERKARKMLPAVDSNAAMRRHVSETIAAKKLEEPTAPDTGEPRTDVLSLECAECQAKDAKIAEMERDYRAINEAYTKLAEDRNSYMRMHYDNSPPSDQIAAVSHYSGLLYVATEKAKRALDDALGNARRALGVPTVRDQATAAERLREALRDPDDRDTDGDAYAIGDVVIITKPGPMRGRIGVVVHIEPDHTGNWLWNTMTVDVGTALVPCFASEIAKRKEV